MVIYRANFTNILRNKRYWNRRNFDGKYGKIPAPQCIDVTKIATDTANIVEQAGNRIQQGINYIY